MIKRRKRQRQAMGRWRRILRDMKACHEGIDWFEQQVSPRRAWAVCHEGMFMRWLMFSIYDRLPRWRNKTRGWICTVCHAAEQAFYNLDGTLCQCYLAEADYFRSKVSYYKLVSLLKQVNLWEE